MVIDRRNVVTGVLATAVAPTLTPLPASPTKFTTETSPVIMMIEGWSVPDETCAGAALWIRVDRFWRTAWR